MYSTRMVLPVVPVAAGVSTFGNWAVLVVSALGLLLIVLLAVRAIRLRDPATHLRDPATPHDQLTEGHRA
jgi:hypothetical protein